MPVNIYMNCSVISIANHVNLIIIKELYFLIRLKKILILEILYKF